ncbi:hypothetical protein MSG28_008906 [Choristoneura fumiferana]|uniref:Uncharacterized protein n=1 Tax=Choristoneura fumiferana TaxID=7141 RepID=A0ACC0J8J0_CHOFU|nr:hypothetical protein MSG28_008906 [Choristoneura fumiferana]
MVILCWSEFVSSYQCTSKKYSRYLQIDSIRSFPSGHSSLSMYCGLFLAVLVLCKNFSQPAVVSTSDISNSDGTNHNPDTKLLPNRVLMP